MVEDTPKENDLWAARHGQDIVISDDTLNVQYILRREDPPHIGGSNEMFDRQLAHTYWKVIYSTHGVNPEVVWCVHEPNERPNQ